MAALRDLKAALTGAEDLTDDEKDRYQAQADRADADDGQIKTAQGHYQDHVVENIEDIQIAAAMKAVEMVTDTSDEDTVTDAQEAIDAAKEEISGANITDAQKATLLAAINIHQGALDRAKLSRTRYTENQTRIAGVVKTITDTQIKAVMDAIEKITNTSDDSTVTDAQTAIDAAKKAITDAQLPDANKETLRRQLDDQETAFNEAKIDREVAMITDGEIKAVMEAIGMITALSEESTVTDVEAAIAAARKAIADAQLPDVNKEALRARLAAQETAFGAAKMDRADGAKRGKALHAAMAGPKATTAPNNALTNLQSAPYYVTALVDSGNDLGTGEAIGRRGDFRIDPAEGAGVIPDGNAHKAVFFRHVGSEHIVDEDDDRFGQPHSTALPNVPKKGKYPENFDTGEHGNVGTEWYVTDFTRTTGSGDDRVTDRVRVYNDKVGGPLTDTRSGYLLEKDLATYFATSEKPVNAGDLDTDKRSLSLGTGVYSATIWVRAARQSG